MAGPLAPGGKSKMEANADVLLLPFLMMWLSLAAVLGALYALSVALSGLID